MFSPMRAIDNRVHRANNRPSLSERQESRIKWSHKQSYFENVRSTPIFIHPSIITVSNSFALRKRYKMLFIVSGVWPVRTYVNTDKMYPSELRLPTFHVTSQSHCTQPAVDRDPVKHCSLSPLSEPHIKASWIRSNSRRGADENLPKDCLEMLTIGQTWSPKCVSWMCGASNVRDKKVFSAMCVSVLRSNVPE